MKLRFKQLVSILLIVCIFALTPMGHIDSYAAAFGDVNGHWAEVYIDTIKPLGVISGYTDGTFKPDKVLKRSEFIAIMVNTLGEAHREVIGNEFWYAPYIETALKLNLISSSEYGGLTPTNLEKEIRREEMASIVVNAFYTTGATLSAESIQTASQTLSDFNKVSSKYYNQAVAAVALNIIEGFTDNTFGPLKNATRAQAAAVSHKLLVRIGKLSEITEPSIYSVNGIKIGDSYSYVLQNYGAPVREDVSEYGFKWLIYHAQYKNYYQIGIQNNKVVALYTASNLLTSSTNLKMNLTKTQVSSILGSPINSITKVDSEYMQYNSVETATYLYKNAYVTAYFDTANGGKMFSIKIVDYATEQAFKSQYGMPSEALRIALEKQLFDLTNVYRVSFNLLPLKWNESLAVVARKHSKDMAVRDFFDHTNPSGYTPFERISADGIIWTLAAENIAAGYTNAFATHSGWVNSPGHRDNLIRDIQELGVGVYLGGKYLNYFTQNFITP